MSGIYLGLWDDFKREHSPVLKPTKGGWPHITVAYTGKVLSAEMLIKVSVACFTDWALRPVTLESAYVNSFEEKAGVMRHDVLLALADDDKKAIETLRNAHVKAHPKAAQFTMRTPHVTHSIHTTAAEAEATAQLINKSLPYIVKVIGVMIE